MRCARCEFENIPGQARCIRCGSVLEAESIAIEVHPPRMPSWSKPLRGVMRWMRGHRLAPEKWFEGPTWQGLDRILSNNAGGMLLSIIPGLAHLLRGRFREVRLWVALWFVCLVLGINLYGSQIGSLMIGLAIGLHAWIALQYRIFREVTELAARVGAVLVIVAGFTALYWVTPRVVVPGFTGAPTPLAIPAMNMHAGDYLLLRRVSESDHPLSRGSLVVFRPSVFRNGRRDVWQDPRVRTIGQIVGLPGEAIRVEENAYFVGAHRLDPTAFPVPHWLRVVSETPVPRGSYFVSTVYTGNARPTAEIIKQACVIPASEIRSRAFMQWWPWTTRGFIE